MASPKQIIEHRLRERLYAAFRDGNEILFVETDEMAVLLGVTPPDEAGSDTAQLGNAQLMGYLASDLDTEECSIDGGSRE